MAPVSSSWYKELEAKENWEYGDPLPCLTLLSNPFPPSLPLKIKNSNLFKNGSQREELNHPSYNISIYNISEYAISKFYSISILQCKRHCVGRFRVEPRWYIARYHDTLDSLNYFLLILKSTHIAYLVAGVMLYFTGQM